MCDDLTIVQLFAGILRLNTQSVCECMWVAKPKSEKPHSFIVKEVAEAKYYTGKSFLKHHTLLCSQHAVPYCAVTSSIPDADTASTLAEGRSINCCPLSPRCQVFILKLCQTDTAGY